METSTSTNTLSHLQAATAQCQSSSAGTGSKRRFHTCYIRLSFGNCLVLLGDCLVLRHSLLAHRRDDCDNYYPVSDAKDQLSTKHLPTFLPFSKASWISVPKSPSGNFTSFFPSPSRAGSVRSPSSRLIYCLSAPSISRARVEHGRTT